MAEITLYQPPERIGLAIQHIANHLIGEHANISDLVILEENIINERGNNLLTVYLEHGLIVPGDLLRHHAEDIHTPCAVEDLSIIERLHIHSFWIVFRQRK